MSQFEGSQAGELSYLGESQPFLLGSSTDWMRPSHIRRAVCFTQPIDLNVNIIQNHPFGNSQNKFWPNICGLPVAQSSWHIKLTITVLSCWGWCARASNTSIARKMYSPLKPSRNHLLSDNITYIISFSVTWLPELAMTLWNSTCSFFPSD